MQLHTAERIFYKEVKIDELKKAFEDDAGRGEFIILQKDKGNFIQAAGEYDSPYILEYREGDKDHHYKCLEKLDKKQVQAIFVKYLKEDKSWKTMVKWEKQDLKPWWKFW
jgi:hypothetical protein